MDWTELCVTVAAADTDRAAAIAAMAAPHGLYIEDYRDLEEGARQIAHSDLIDEELLARDRTRTRIHLYLEPGRRPPRRRRTFVNGCRRRVSRSSC